MNILTRIVALASLQILASPLAQAIEPAPAALVCDAIRAATPLESRLTSEKMAFETGDIAPVCKPFVKFVRKDLDRCGDTKRDPYTLPTSSTSTSSFGKSGATHADDTESDFTWSSRNEMVRRGKVNLFTDPDLRAQMPAIQHRIDALKDGAADLCCAGDVSCKAAFERVDVSFCQPSNDPNAPDPCVFGGSYKMSGDGYSSIFQAIARVHGEAEAHEFRQIAQRNLTPQETRAAGGMTSGRIVLSSYVSKAVGPAAFEPTLLHEFGHACSMIRMQQWSLEGAGHEVPKETSQRALRAARWLDSARTRCQPDMQLPEAYNDFWSAVGESHELAQCLYHLTSANQKQQTADRTCPGLCPGHYLEESVGIVFSLLLGGVSTETAPNPAAVFPNTCDHVRDGQHPMVSDVVDCLTQHSPRFRDKLRAAYRCG